MSTNVTRCEIDFRVRYAESDPMGYLHHSKYMEYFEVGRTELLRQAGFRYRDLEARGILFVVTKIQCKFHKPARYDDELTLKIRIVRQTTVRIDHEYELYRDGIRLTEAATTLACVDREGKVIQIPEEMGV